MEISLLLSEWSANIAKVPANAIITALVVMVQVSAKIVMVVVISKKPPLAVTAVGEEQKLWPLLCQQL